MSRRTRHPYTIKIGGVLVDPYRIMDEYDLHPVIAQAVKKLLRGGRQDKSMEQDVEEAIRTLRRWQEIRADRRLRHAKLSGGRTDHE